MSKVAILGAGNMGTALSVVLSEKKDNQILLWSVEEDIVEEINKKNKNIKYLKGVDLKSNVKATSDLKIAVKDADFVIFSVPSQVIRIVAGQAQDLIPEESVIVDVAKGLEKKSNKRMSEVLREFYKNSIISIGGPSIANDLGRKIPTFVVFASEDKKALKKAVKVFQTSYYSITTNSDVVGVELCGALKNIIAILAGVSDGLGYSTNTKAGIITKGLEELKVIVEKMGGKKESVYSLAGLGDLVVTCTSQHSRNRRFGELLARGESKESAKKIIGQVVEGENVILMVKKLIEEYDLNSPLIKKVYNIVVKGEKPSV